MGSACEVCPVGKISQKKKGSTSCQGCGPGHRLPKMKCVQCAKGQYSVTGESKKCIKCEKGKFAAAKQSSTCDVCPAGKMPKKNRGSASCKKDRSARRTLASFRTLASEGSAESEGEQAVSRASGASGTPTTAVLTAAIAASCLSVITMAL